MPDRPILEIMHAVLSIHPDASVEEAVQKMSSQGMEAILIKQEEEYTGIFKKTDLIKLLEKNIAAAEVNVSTFMSKPILSLDASTSEEETRKRMVEKNIRQYAVTQNGKIAGLISIKDLDS